MRSMTGFGSSSSDNQQWLIETTVYSVNHKRLDIHLFLPPELKTYDYALRQMIQEFVIRGAVTVRVALAAQGEEDAPWHVDDALITLIENRLGLSRTEWTPEMELKILSIPGALQQSAMVFQEKDEGLLFESMRKALEAHAASRDAEGLRLKNELLQEIEAFGEKLSVLKTIAPTVQQDNERKLREHLEAVVGHAYDEKRLLEELVYYATRTSIHEELVRLDSHVAEVRKQMHQDGAIGKHCDFYFQEMQRETNTSGTKINDFRGSQAIISMKTILDGLREQIQNIE